MEHMAGFTNVPLDTADKAFDVYIKHQVPELKYANLVQVET
jgi:hypothetical protein